jgi:hypothetical protein
MSFTVPVGSHIDDGEHHKINRLSRFFFTHFLSLPFCLAKLCIAKHGGRYDKDFNYRRTQSSDS